MSHVHEDHTHSHPHTHEEHEEHDHQHGTPGYLHDNHLRTDKVVLNIGANVGALILYTNADADGVEIEITPKGRPDVRSHNQVHPRNAPAGVVYAAVYPELEEGEYDLWGEGPDPVSTVKITGGQVTELDWR